MSRTEQRLPDQNDAGYCQDTLLPIFSHAVEVSKARGVETYGTALQPFNARNSYQDAFEEWVDLGMYLEQMRREREVIIEVLREAGIHAKVTQNLDLWRRIGRMLEGLGEKVD